MKCRNLYYNVLLHFSHWSKKGYAVFAGLGREVKISRLAIHMYKNVLLKASRHGVIVNLDKTVILLLVELMKEEMWQKNTVSEGEVCPRVSVPIL